MLLRRPWVYRELSPRLLTETYLELLMVPELLKKESPRCAQLELRELLMLSMLDTDALGGLGKIESIESFD